MKIKSLMFALVAVGCMMLTGCKDDPVFDGDLIVGKWVAEVNGSAGTEYYRYDADGTGVTWDTGDDVHEEEGQPYTWSFDQSTSRLTLIHQMEMGGVVPKSYTVTVLDEQRLEYKDNSSQKFAYIRVSE